MWERLDIGQWVVHAHPSAPSPSPCSSAVLEGGIHWIAGSRTWLLLERSGRHWRSARSAWGCRARWVCLAPRLLRGPKGRAQCCWAACCDVAWVDWASFQRRWSKSSSYWGLVSRGGPHGASKGKRSSSFEKSWGLRSLRRARRPLFGAPCGDTPSHGDRSTHPHGGRFGKGSH